MSLPAVTSRQEWLAARKELLVREKELTRLHDALNTSRRQLPMVRIDKEYVFEGPDGKASLTDMFGPSGQLVLQHVMFDPAWDDACPSCSAGAGRAVPRAAQKSAGQGHGVRRSRQGSADEDRGVQGAQGLGLCLVLVVRQRLQLRLPRHASTPRSPR